MSHQPSAPEAVVAAFSFNKNLHQAKLDWRFNEQFTDARWATAYVGAELLAQQERAATRYDQNSKALRASVDEQTRQNADHARVLQTTIRESSDAVRREMTNVQDAVHQTTDAVNGLTSQVAHLAWLQAEQNTTLRSILKTIRESRANECRQLVEQGERNFHAGYLDDAEERFRLALGFDNTDYPTHQNLGLTLVRLGRMDEALEHFRKALAFPPKNDAKASGFFVARAATHAARVLYAKSDYAGAETYLQRALDADATSAKNWYDLAVVRAYQGNTRGVLDALTHAFDGDPHLAGAALADEELATIRSAIEQLVIEQTARAMSTDVEKPADALRATNRRIAEIARAVGVQVQPSNVDNIVEKARVRGTLPGMVEAAISLRWERHALLGNLRDALQKARVAAEDKTRASLQSLDADRTARSNNARQRTDSLRSAASEGSNPLAQIGFTLLGIIVGAIIGGNVKGCVGVVFGAGFGAFIGLGVYAAIYHSNKATANSELDEALAGAGHFQEEMAAQEAKIKADGAARLKQIDGYMAEFSNMVLSN